VLSIFDVQGRRVAAQDLGIVGAGPHLVRWDGRADGGETVGTGVYWARLEVGSTSFTRRVVHLQ